MNKLNIQPLLNEKEFNKPADELLEAVRQYLTRSGQKVDKKTILKVANAILENRK